MKLRLTNDKEDAERFLRVLDLRQEVRCKAEGHCNLRRLVEVRLQHVPDNRSDGMRCDDRSNKHLRVGLLIKDEEALQDL